MLDEANRAHPGVWWLVKGDGCDIRAGLGESLTHIWSGDVDMCDGSLPKLYQTYMNRRSFVEGLGLGDRRGQWDISIDLSTIELEMITDIDFISEGMLHIMTRFFPRWNFLPWESCLRFCTLEC